MRVTVSRRKHTRQLVSATILAGTLEMHTPLIDGDPRPSLRTGATALTKTYDFQPGLPRLGANLMESFGIGDNGFVSPEKFSF